MYTKLFYCFKISAFEHMIFRVNVYRKPNLAKNWSFAFRLMAKMKMLYDYGKFITPQNAVIIC